MNPPQGCLSTFLQINNNTLRFPVHISRRLLEIVEYEQYCDLLLDFSVAYFARYAKKKTNPQNILKYRKNRQVVSQKKLSEC